MDFIDTGKITQARAEELGSSIEMPLLKSAEDSPDEEEEGK